MTRREFLIKVETAAVLAGLPALAGRAAQPSGAWPIGCMNRPWGKWGLDAALDGIKEAGYPLVGLLMRSKEDPLIGAEATPDYLAKLHERIASRGLRANMAALRSRHNIPIEESVAELRQQVDHAKQLRLEYLLSFGVDRPAEFDQYYRAMAQTAAYAQDAGVKLVLKPHGGGSGAAEEILRCLEKVNHPNFKIWYDAGNIIHYTGKDPVAELSAIARHVTGFCAKDCPGLKGEVMIKFGSGKVNFEGVFRKLKDAGFHGPLMVEGSDPGQSAAEATRHARANREFLEAILKKL